MGGKLKGIPGAAFFGSVLQAGKGKGGEKNVYTERVGQKKKEVRKDS